MDVLSLDVLCSKYPLSDISRSLHVLDSGIKETLHKNKIHGFGTLSSTLELFWGQESFSDPEGEALKFCISLQRANAKQLLRNFEDNQPPVCLRTLIHSGLFSLARSPSQTSLIGKDVVLLRSMLRIAPPHAIVVLPSISTNALVGMVFEERSFSSMTKKAKIIYPLRQEKNLEEPVQKGLLNLDRLWREQERWACNSEALIFETPQSCQLREFSQKSWYLMCPEILTPGQSLSLHFSFTQERTQRDWLSLGFGEIAGKIIAAHPQHKISVLEFRSLSATEKSILFNFLITHLRAKRVDLTSDVI